MFQWLIHMKPICLYLLVYFDFSPTDFVTPNIYFFNTWIIYSLTWLVHCVMYLISSAGTQFYGLYVSLYHLGPSTLLDTSCSINNCIMFM